MSTQVQVTTTPYDPEAIDALACYWLRHIDGEPAPYDNDSTAAAAHDILIDAIRGATQAGVDVPIMFRHGVELGVTIALAVVNDPVSNPLPALKAAIDHADRDLRSYAREYGKATA